MYIYVMCILYEVILIFFTKGSVEITQANVVPGKGVPPPPPPPSLPRSCEASGGASNSVSKSSNDRAALLGSICNFDKTRLRRITNGHR